MGLFDKVKGFFNVGGVSLKITKVENPFKAGDTWLSGKFTLKTDTDRTVLSYSARFYKKVTTKENNEEKTDTDTLGRISSKDYMISDTYPFELAAGETRELDFDITNVNCPVAWEHQEGVIGTVGKLAAFASSMSGSQEKVEYFVEVTADVKGTPFDPSDTVQIQVVPGK